MRKLRLLFLLAILMGCTKSFAANFYDFTVNGIAYKITSNSAPYTVEVTFNDVTKEMYAKPTYIGNITIPTIVAYGGNSYSVTSIGNNAFNGCSGLKSVTIPNSVTSIGNYAFENCSSLTSVTIPNSVTSIGTNAFYGCSGLTSVTIPNSVTSIGTNAFNGCSGMTSVTIPSSVTSIGSSAFFGCSGLTAVNITDLAAWCKITLGDNPLYYAHHLYLDGSEVKDVLIPDGVTSLSRYIFSGCSSLTSVTIGNDVTSIETDAFAGCRNLSTLSLPNSVAFIGDEAFSGCTNLLNITTGITSLFCFQENVFANNVYNHAIVHVPVGMLKNYCANVSWGRFLNITETPLGINSITTDQKNSESPCYDMQGREVLNPERGHIYIKDGKKILIQ